MSVNKESGNDPEKDLLCVPHSVKRASLSF
jgi:hypothetical protein